MVMIGGTSSVRLVLVALLFWSSVFCSKARVVWWLHIGDTFDENLKTLSHHRGVVTSLQVFSANFTINNETGALDLPPEKDTLSWLGRVRSELGGDVEVFIVLGTGHWRRSGPVDPFPSAIMSREAEERFSRSAQDAAMRYNLTGYNIDWENGWNINRTCGSPKCTTHVLAEVIRTLSSSVAVTLCVDVGDPLCNFTSRPTDPSAPWYGPCGYLDVGAMPHYIAAGVSRVQQMGTYPLKPPFSEERQAIMVDRVIDAVGGDPERVGIGISFQAHAFGNQENGEAWSEGRLKVFFAHLRKRRVSEVDMFVGKEHQLEEMPGYFWDQLQAFEGTKTE